MPVVEEIVLRSSTALRESTPASRSGSFSLIVFPMILNTASFTWHLKKSLLCLISLISRDLETMLLPAEATVSLLIDLTSAVLNE